MSLFRSRRVDLPRHTSGAHGTDRRDTKADRPNASQEIQYAGGCLQPRDMESSQRRICLWANLPASVANAFVTATTRQTPLGKTSTQYRRSRREELLKFGLQSRVASTKPGRGLTGHRSIPGSQATEGMGSTAYPTRRSADRKQWCCAAESTRPACRANGPLAYIHSSSPDERDRYLGPSCPPPCHALELQGTYCEPLRNYIRSWLGRNPSAASSIFPSCSLCFSVPRPF